MSRVPPGSSVAKLRPAHRRAVLAAVAALMWLAAATVACAQAPSGAWHAYRRDFHFQQLNGHDGLAQNTVSLIFQDHKGFIWLVTQGGLFRYDGHSLRRYAHDPAHADSLPDDYMVTSLADAGDGRLWVGSSTGGLTLFDPDAGKVLPIPAGVRRSNVPVTGLLRLANGDVLLGTPRGVDRLVASSTPRLQRVWAEPAGSRIQVRSFTRCPDGDVYAAVGDRVLAIDKTGHAGHVLATNAENIDALYCGPEAHLLLGDARGLQSVDRESGALATVWHGTRSVAIGVRAIVADHAGQIWLGLSDHDLLRMNADGSTTRVVPAPVGVAGGLPGSGIRTLFVDRTGLLWVGTSTAGAVWTRPTGSPIRAVLDISGDPRARAHVRAFYPAPDGQLWIALNGPGLVRYAPGDGTVTSYAAKLRQAVTDVPAAPPSSSRTASGGPTDPAADQGISVSAILPDADGTLLLPTNRGILRFDPATGKAARAHFAGIPADTPVRALFHARNGDWWVAPHDAGLDHYHDGQMVQRFDQAHGLASDHVLVIGQDHAGNIWAGTTRGVSMIDPATGKVHSFRETRGDPHSLAGRMVVSLLFTRKGRVWIGSLSGISLLEHLDAHGAQFRRYGIGDALPDNTIDCMLEGDKGDIWFSTNLGIGQLDPKTGAIRSYDAADGLQGSEYNMGACLRTADGSLLFGGHGFDIINPAKAAPAEPPAPVVITELYDSKGRIPVPASSTTAALTLPPDDHGFLATFATLDYASSGHNRFRYRLLGRDDNWSTPTHNRSVSYSQLAPGDYRLEVQSILRDGSLGTTTSLAVHVDSAWWWNPAMRIVYAIAIALLIVIALLGWRSHHLEQVRHRRQLRLREGRLRQALWGSGDEFWDWNLEHGTILRLGPEGTPGGHHEQSVPAEEWRRTMVHPDDLANLDHALAEHLAGHTEHFEVEHRVRGRDDEWTWVLSRGKVVERDESGKALRICGTERDISAIRAADRDRRIATEVIRNMSEAVTVTDLDFRFISVNTAFTRMTGYAEHEVLGRDASVLNGSRHAPDSYTHLRQTLAETGHWRGELWQRRKDGEEFLSWVELNEVCDASGQRTHMIGVLTDITDRKRAEQELRYLANYDTLTGLPNRALLGERLGAAVINARRSGHKVGLLFLDLDRFKHVNDSLGHTAGDRTLKAAGARLRQCVRENDVVARLGGDEFTVVLEDLADTGGAEEMAQRLIQAFAKPLPVSGTQETVISPSIGIALYPDHGQTPADLLKCADTAMYQAKASGRNTWAVYHPGMDARARDHATLINALRRALDRGELRLVYQPKMSLHDEIITGMEALLRWHNRDLGEIPPSVFIPLAEETGQIHEISAYVFGTACADLSRFRENGHRNLTMAINLSAAQLNRPDLTAHICDLLAEHDVAPNQIELELTETMVMANAEQSVRLLGELKSIGARLAIDDFGTGYSSLAYLKRLPIDTLKIDQEFVGDITTDPDDAAITSTIITMAHSLQVRVVAEGVETAEQLAFLRAQHCDEIQGYWLSRPLSAEACLDFLDRHTAARVAS